MPRVKIETTRDLKIAEQQQILATALDALVMSLQLVDDDRTGSIQVHTEGCSCMKPPYEFYIEIPLFTGRSKAVKKELYTAVVNALQQRHQIDPLTVMIMHNEQPRENWGLRGGVPGDEITFGYTIER